MQHRAATNSREGSGNELALVQHCLDMTDIDLGEKTPRVIALKTVRGGFSIQRAK